MMNRVPVILLFIGCLLVSGDIVSARETPRRHRDGDLGRPMFALQTYKRFSERSDMCRIDIALEVENDVLQFIREGEYFFAEAEISVAIFDSDEEQVYYDLQHLTRKVSTFDLTNSRRDFITGIFSTELPPGDYTLKALLVDRESNQREIIDREFVLELPDMSAGLAMSDLILTRSSSTDAGSKLPKHITVSGAVLEESSALFCYFDLIRRDPLKACQLSLNIIDRTGRMIPADSLSLIGGNINSSYFLKIPTQDLGFAGYDLILTATCDSARVTRKRSFRVNYHGLPSDIRDIEQAIRQLKYIAEDDEIERLLNLFPSNKEEKFLKFWKDNFPTLGESTNGKMLEYYQRVDYSNENFGNNHEGWTTDRGQVLIMFGHPSDIERPEADEYNVYYEIWFYNHLNRRFVFKDDYGFGEFRLVSNIW